MAVMMNRRKWCRKDPDGLWRGYAEFEKPVTEAYTFAEQQYGSSYDPPPPGICICNKHRRDTYLRVERRGDEYVEDGSRRGAVGETARGFAPIFIVGLPRSGTSLAERILASHPECVGRGERSCLESFEWQIDRGLLSIDVARQNYIRHSRTDLRPIDKMPLNFTRIPLIRKLFPNASIVHTERDKLDTLLSCYCLPLGKMAWSFDLLHLSEYYKDYLTIMDEYAGEVDYTLNYELLIRYQDFETGSLLSRCGLEWDDKCLELPKSGGTIATSSHWQCRQKVYSSSIGRHKNYPDFCDRIQEYMK